MHMMRIGNDQSNLWIDAKSIQAVGPIYSDTYREGEYSFQIKLASSTSPLIVSSDWLQVQFRDKPATAVEEMLKQVRMRVVWALKNFGSVNDIPVDGLSFKL